MCACSVIRNGFISVMMQGVARNFVVLQPMKTAMTLYDVDVGRQVNVPELLKKLYPQVVRYMLKSCHNSNFQISVCLMLKAAPDIRRRH